MDFEAAQAQHASQQAEKAAQQLINNYGFPEERSRAAVAAVGPDVQAAVNWLLDHGEEDRGGAVSLVHCPHTDNIAALLPPHRLEMHGACCNGCPGSEVWVCLFCGCVRCSRYQQGCMVKHAEETRAEAERTATVGDAASGAALGHHLVLSCSDLSVWCYECEAYVEPTSGRNPIVAPLVRRAEALKHGLAEPPEKRQADVAVGSALAAPVAAQHGLRGDAQWEAPRVAAVAHALARPGYRTCAAHEYEDAPEVLRAKAQLLACMIRDARSAVAYTGAGISTAAGIADYATKTGGHVLREEQEKVADPRAPFRGGYGDFSNRSSPASSIPAVSGVNPASPISPVAPTEKASPYDAAPTRAHHILVRLHAAGLLPRWVQQNHDGLPQKAGFPQEALNEIHGSWFDPSNPVVPMDGTLRTDLLDQLLEWEESSDLCLALGSTLCGMNADRIASSVAQRARNGSGQGLVIVNLQQTQFDHFCALRIFARIDDVMALVAEELNLPDAVAVAPVERDVFDVPYAQGEKADQTSRLDLTPGATVKIVRQPTWDAERVGSLARVVGRTRGGDWELEFPGGVRRRLGAWWLRAAATGAVPCLPITS